MTGDTAAHAARRRVALQEFEQRLRIFEDNLRYITEYNAKQTGVTVRNRRGAMRAPARQLRRSFRQVRVSGRVQQSPAPATRARCHLLARWREPLSGPWPV